ncbi:MAG: hypothetical protein P8I94_06590 [Emcibacteraceae bacterium]|nr:hypothetical protein [Emcibacteraceae bacterium]
MPLQTSGAISLNDIHIEAGGVTQTLASINDSDIRALIGKGSGVTMSFSEWYGASAGFPDGTYYARDGIGGNVSGASSHYVVGPYATANAGFDVRVVKDANGLSVYVNESYSSANTYYKNTSGTNVTMSGDTEVLIYQMSGQSVDSIKVDYALVTGFTSNSGGAASILSNTSETPAATYNIADNAWQSLSSGQSMGRRFYASAFSGTSSGGRGNVGGSFDIIVWARKSGLPDTAMCEFTFTLNASAEWVY